MLTVPKRGRKHGEQRRLIREQEKQIQKMIVDHYPDQSKLPYALWDRHAVRQLILQQFGLNLPIRTFGDYLSRWGYTPQRSIRKVYEQRPVEVERLMEELYLAIKEKANAENAKIYWSDEIGISTSVNLMRGYAPAGKLPVLRLNARKEHISIMSASNNKEQLRFMLKDVGRKIILILDTKKVNHCRPVKEWLSKHADQKDVFYLAAY
jgi:transposase